MLLQHRSDMSDQLSQGSGEEVELSERLVARSPRHVSLRRRKLNKFGAVAGEVGNFALVLVVVFLVFTLLKPLVGCKGE